MFIYKNNYDGRNIKAWACTILKNEFINECRFNKKHTDEPIEKAIKLEGVFNPESEVNVLYIEKQIDSLPVRLKDVFKDRILGLSYNELVEKYKKPMGTIKAYIFESRQKLMKIA
jgi:DNA-directed RNA polymerase specialized sigma24 family protein